MEDYLSGIRAEIIKLSGLAPDERIDAINHVKRLLHDISPFKDEPVDCVIWVKNDFVGANDYNPNTVAPPEMKLLDLSITADGFTQPIVTSTDGDPLSDITHFEVVDGFHRSKVGRISPTVRKRTGDYVPITLINQDRNGRGDRIASTIRHNRARGKHGVGAMSEIVVELARRNWSNEKIGKELGMEPDEVLRLKQISGLAEMFATREFSEAWEIDEAVLCKT